MRRSVSLGPAEKISSHAEAHTRRNCAARLDRGEAARGRRRCTQFAAVERSFRKRGSWGTAGESVCVHLTGWSAERRRAASICCAQSKNAAKNAMVARSLPSVKVLSPVRIWMPMLSAVGSLSACQNCVHTSVPLRTLLSWRKPHSGHAGTYPLHAATTSGALHVTRQSDSRCSKGPSRPKPTVVSLQEWTR